MLPNWRRPLVWTGGSMLTLAVIVWPVSAGLVPLPCPTNLTITVMAGNLTGQSQRYEEPQIRILQGLKPDLVAIQEFRYGESSAAELRALVDLAFGTNYCYYRESSATEDYSIPNGIVSRFPITDAGCWDDVTLPDRGFAWARIGLPGTNELYLVSVHLKASGGSENLAKRVTAASNLVALIQSNFPAGAWIVVAGDLNTGSRGEQTLTILKEILSDDPVPTDAAIGGNEKTNRDRDRPYDYVLPSFALTNRLAPVVVGGQWFSNGLVFDSRVFTPLEAVPPIQPGDSTNGQHMAVIKAFQVTCLVTNWIDLSPPRLHPAVDGVIRWTSPSNLLFRVQANVSLTKPGGWTTVASASSTTTNFSFTANPGPSPLFYRVICP